jgi:hypothetical protein
VSRRTAAIVAWTLVAASAVLGFAGTGMTIAVEGLDGWHFVATDGLAITIFLVSAVVGALVASRLPTNPIGWIFVGLAVSLGLSGAADGYVSLAVDRGQLGGFTPWAAWYSSNSFIALFATFFLTLLLFPNGQVLTPRWRIVLWTGAVALVLFAVAVVFQPGKFDDYPRITNPVGVDNAVLFALGFVGVLLFGASLIASAVSLVVRFRRARGVERQQLTLLVAAGILATALFLVSWPIESEFGADDLGIAITLIGILAIPVAIGVAMLRYRLYEVDRVISKTLVYGSLTVILGVAYAGLVLAGQAVFSSFAGGSDLAIAGSTLVVAALFLPLRARVQRLVDRRFYRRRYDAQRTLDVFGTRLREQVELDELKSDLRRVVRETMQPAHVSLWLRGEGAE